MESRISSQCECVVMEKQHWSNSTDRPYRRDSVSHKKSVGAWQQSRRHIIKTHRAENQPVRTWLRSHKQFSSRRFYVISTVKPAVRKKKSNALDAVFSFVNYHLIPEVTSFLNRQNNEKGAKVGWQGEKRRRIPPRGSYRGLGLIAQSPRLRP